jgi:hypothetical protein
MTARVWTVEELDRVHPLPRGWHWRIEDGGVDDGDGYHLTAVDPSDHDPFNDDDAEVWVLDGGLESTRASIPTDVALPVILASKGLDSREAMAAEIESAAKRVAVEAGSMPDFAHAAHEMGRARQAVAIAEMLRRGTVEP